MSRKNFTLLLQWAKMIAPRVKHLAFSLAEDQLLTFIPGQFITLHIPADKTVRRSYSIANSPDNGCKMIELAASYVPKGIASEFLFALQPGDAVTATGPFGRLILRDPCPKRYVFVATGTGVTPYRAMLRELERCQQQYPYFETILLFGVRRPEDLLYRDEFVTFAAKHPWFRFRAYYSQTQLASPLPYEYYGYVLNAFSDIQPDPTQDVIYLCGNPNMVDEVFALLITQGFATENIRREKYISSS